DPAVKKKSLRLFTTGMYLVTAGTSDEHGAFTANWITQSAFEPPMIAIAVEQDAHSLSVIRAAGAFAVHVLESGQRELAGQFGRSHAKVGNKLAGYAWRPGSTGAPLVDLALAAIECRVVSETPSGDHVLILAEVVDAHLWREGTPLTMAEAGFRYSG
ncbi:MAG TPA: flavin reductase family protein, partial [Chloroflexia bacterium]|nr:flavin reductase family protein [Chloroflexia bacterium]